MVHSIDSILSRIGINRIKTLFNLIGHNSWQVRRTEQSSELYLSPQSLLLTRYLIVLRHSVNQERILKFYSYSRIDGINNSTILHRRA